MYYVLLKSQRTSQTGSTAPDASPRLIKYLLSDRYNHKVYGGEIKDLLPLSNVKFGENGKHYEHYVIDFWSLGTSLPPFPLFILVVLITCFVFIRQHLKKIQLHKENVYFSLSFMNQLLQNTSSSNILPPSRHLCIETAPRFVVLLFYYLELLII